MKRLVAAVAVSLLGLAACGETSSPAVPGGETKKDDVLAHAPVAAAADILPGSTMEKIKQRGELIVGGSLDAPLLSQQNPVTGKVEGFDADLGKALAKYIIGKPKVKIVNSAPGDPRGAARQGPWTWSSRRTRSPRSGPSRSPSPGRTSPRAWPSR